MGCSNNKNKDQQTEETKDVKLQKPAKSPCPEELQINYKGFINEKRGNYQDEYILGKELGAGTFGIVREVIHKQTGEKRALKIIAKTALTKDEQQMKMVNDIVILKELDHPNIIKTYEFYQDDQNYYIVTELANGGELFDKIIEKGNISEKESSYIMKQLLTVMNYSHKLKITHRDIKPENILLDIKQDDEYAIKIIDWGAATKIIEGQYLTNLVGTPYYIAPEVQNRKYNEKCDIWSCGVLMYILLSGDPPFNGDNDAQIMANSRLGKFDFNQNTIWNQISNEAKELITKMLTLDYTQRITAEQCLQHEWFRIAVDRPVNQEIAKTTLTNIKKFNAGSKLQQAALTFIAQQFITKQERDNLMNIFKSLDKNGDGTLSKEEILNGYKKYLSDEAANEEVQKIIQKLDLDENGSINYTEFLVASVDQSKMTTKQNLKASFDFFDKDGNGYVTIDELKKVLGEELNSKDEKVWQSLFNNADKNKDGKISFDEFSEIITKFI